MQISRRNDARRCSGLSVLLAMTIFATVIAAPQVFAQEKVPREVAWHPTAIPDRIVLTWNDDPAATQAVTWRTDASVGKGIAQLAKADHGPRFANNLLQEIPAECTPLESNLGRAHYHTAQFAGLAPRTKYAYRVGDGVNWSEWSHFQTASDKAAPFSFVYFGDAQNSVKSHWSRVVREAYSDAPKAAFMLHAGDLINGANNDHEWGEWFYASGFIHRMIPAVATPGNHEYSKERGARGKTSSRALSKHWRPTFAFPENGPAGLAESAYWLDYQGVRIVSLNSNERQDEQAKWLQEALGGNPHRWAIVTFHHPIYSSRAGRDNKELRELWQPIFDEHRVDLVLQGHDHTYARTRMMTFQAGSLGELAAQTKNVPLGVTKQSDPGGTVYVVSVSGPKMYDLGRRPFMVRAAEDTQLYQIITVDGDELRYEARTAVGKLYDAFTLKKREGQSNELIEQKPSSPDRRRAAPQGSVRPEAGG